MPKTILMDEIHIAVIVPRQLEEAEKNAVFRTLRSKRFLQSLRAAVRAGLARHASLRNARFRINR